MKITIETVVDTLDLRITVSPPRVRVWDGISRWETSRSIWNQALKNLDGVEYKDTAQGVAGEFVGYEALRAEIARLEKLAG